MAATVFNIWNSTYTHTSPCVQTSGGKQLFLKFNPIRDINQSPYLCQNMKEFLWVSTAELYPVKWKMCKVLDLQIDLVWYCTVTWNRTAFIFTDFSKCSRHLILCLHSKTYGVSHRPFALMALKTYKRFFFSHFKSDFSILDTSCCWEQREQATFREAPSYPLIHWHLGDFILAVLRHWNPSNWESVQCCQHQGPLLGLQACHLLFF